MVDTTRPIHLNYPNFEKVVGNSTVLVDFWAEWCAPCKVQDPILDEVAGEMQGKILIGKVNVDDNRVLASKYNIMSITHCHTAKLAKNIHSQNYSTSTN